MLPVERKNEYLNYVMITEPYDKWPHVVYGYIIDNNIKNWKEGFDFVVKYADDPSWHAYLMVKDGFAEPEWGRKVIENATTDGQSIIAYHMVIGGHATQEWYEEIKRKNDVSS